MNKNEDYRTETSTSASMRVETYLVEHGQGAREPFNCEHMDPYFKKCPMFVQDLITIYYFFENTCDYAAATLFTKYKITKRCMNKLTRDIQMKSIAE